jgi:hypothetical protein
MLLRVDVGRPKGRLVASPVALVQVDVLFVGGRQNRWDVTHHYFFWKDI